MRELFADLNQATILNIKPQVVRKLAKNYPDFYCSNDWCDKQCRWCSVDYKEQQIDRGRVLLLAAGRRHCVPFCTFATV